jgi:hypothetical protein
VAGQVHSKPESLDSSRNERSFRTREESGLHITSLVEFSPLTKAECFRKLDLLRYTRPVGFGRSDYGFEKRELLTKHECR